MRRRMPARASGRNANTRLGSTPGCLALCVTLAGAASLPAQQPAQLISLAELETPGAMPPGAMPSAAAPVAAAARPVTAAGPAATAVLATTVEPAATVEPLAWLPDAPSTQRAQPAAAVPYSFGVSRYAPREQGGTEPNLSPDLSLQALPVADREHLGAVDLSIDQAVATSLKGNLNIRLSGEQEKIVHGEILTVGNALLPNLQLKAYSNAQEINLAALGLKKSELDAITLPGFNPATFATIIKVDVTAAQLSLSQTLFNVPAYFLFRAAEKAAEASHEVTQQARGQVVQGVGGMYLQAIADASQARYARSLIDQDQVVYEHARLSRDAGVGINLDVLRAQTDLLNEQQRLAQAENAVAKDKIQINRLMGQPAGQELNLTDVIPFKELAEQPLEEQLAIAYRNRHDLKGFEAQLTVAEQAQRAVKYERLPTLQVSGFYGVAGVTTTSAYHGNFVAEFQATLPLFLEGELRGQREEGSAQIMALRNQISNTRALIESDVRASRLDLESSRQLVAVARSNVALAQEALDDSTLRFTSGVSDNLPVAQAQAALVNAQSSVVQAEFQYNFAKLTLARRLGVAETDYRAYLGR